MKVNIDAKGFEFTVSFSTFSALIKVEMSLMRIYIELLIFFSAH